MLDDRFKLLTGGSRSSLERHRTLRATVQWSYDHLEEEEKELFVELSVFSGGWSLPAAAAVSGRDTFVILDLMTRLIDKSLVVSDGQGEEEARYHMLETLRQFGEELLSGSGRADELRDKHLDYFLERVGTDWITREVEDNFSSGRRYRTDLENFRSALGWSLDHRPAVSIQLFAGLLPLWHYESLYHEGRSWGERAIPRMETADSTIQARAYRTMTRICMMQGQYEQAFDYGQEALAILRRIDAPRSMVFVLSSMAGQKTYLGEYQSAVSLLEEGLALAENLEDRVAVATVRTGMGLSSYLQGDFEAARAQFEFCAEVWYL